MKIGELVTQAENAYFANDVKLDVFDDPDKNSALAECFKFTYRVPNAANSPQLSSIRILEKLRLSMQHGLDENRHLVLAYYGHGKSHFALALANFFGKPIGSVEVESMLQHIAHASDDSVAENFRDFKSNGVPHLVVLLKGDEGVNLPQQFMSGLDRAIKRLTGDGDTRLPFWFDAAARFLDGLTDEQVAKVDQVLTSNNIDVQDLLQQVRANRTDRYELCVRAFTHLHGTPPDFGGEFSLEQAVKWAVSEYCSGPNHRCAGLVVIFDEFLAFVEDYYRRMQGGGTTSALQSMLNGISLTRGQSLFVGFSQRDPDQALLDLAQSATTSNDVQDLQRELSRLPLPNRYQMYSSLETVLDGYLRQNDDLWSTIYENHFQQIQSAGNGTRSLMGRLYEDSVGWTDERFEEIITKGCFPLHPLTTALYCNLQIAGDSRRMLQFALDSVTDHKDEPVLGPEGGLNWVYPIALVDFFKQSLTHTDVGDNFQSICARFGGSLSPAQVDVLKGMLLYVIGGLTSTGRVRYPDAISLLTGHSHDSCTKLLGELEDIGAIENNASLGVYLFVRGAETQGLKSWLTKQRPSRKFEEVSFRALMEGPESIGFTERYRVDGVKLGHSEDWSAPETLLPASLFDVNRTRAIIHLADGMKNNTICDALRGAMIRVFARNDEELRTLQSGAAEILDNAIGANPSPIPIIVCVPQSPQPLLADALLDLITITQRRAEVLREFGVDACQRETNKLRDRVKQETRKMSEWEEFVLPQAYRAGVSAYATGDRDTLRSRLIASYHIAYGIAPAERYERFITQYKADNANLRRAVGGICKLLVQDRVRDRINAISDKGVSSTATNIVEVYLRDRWGVLTRNEGIVEPTGGVALPAWQHVERSFPVGEELGSIRSALIPLLNPPFGLDFNQVALVFCTWFGLHRSTLEFQEKYMNAWVARDMSPHLALLDKPKHFVEHICLALEGRIRRRDTDQEQKENLELIKRARDCRDYTMVEAQTDLAQLTVITAGAESDDNLKSQAIRASRLLEQEIQTSEEYSAGVRPILEALKRSPGAIEILKLRRRAEGLTESKRVQPEVERKSAVLSNLDAHLDNGVAESVANYSRLSSIRQFDSHHDKLTELRAVLDTGGKRQLVEIVDKGLTALNKSALELEQQKGDAQTLAGIRGVRVPDTLNHMREGLQLLNELTAKSAAASQQLKDKRIAVTQAIRSQEQKLRERRAEIEHIAGSQEARELHVLLLQEKSTYQGAVVEAGIMDTLLTRCATIELVLKLTEAETKAYLQSPQQALERRTELQAAKEIHSDKLFVAQMQLVLDALSRLDKSVEERQKQAAEWLNQLTVDTLNNGVDAGKLAARIGDVPAFLPPHLVGDVEGLRGTIQGRINTNEIVAISHRFRKLDKPKRIECIELLKSILEVDIE